MLTLARRSFESTSLLSHLAPPTPTNAAPARAPTVKLTTCLSVAPSRATSIERNRQEACSRRFGRGIHVRASTDPAGQWRDIVAEEDLDWAVGQRQVPLEIDRHIEIAFRPVSVPEAQAKTDHQCAQLTG
jgi:hypothetical protein